MLRRTKTYFKYIKLLNYSKYLTCTRVPMVDTSQFLTLSSISLFSETSSIFMIRSYVIFPWTWRWKSMISLDFYKKHCVLRSLAGLNPAVPCAPPNCSTLCSSPVRQEASENKAERFTSAHWLQKFQTVVPAQPPQACSEGGHHDSGCPWLRRVLTS